METKPVKITCVVNYFKEEKVNEKSILNIFRIVLEQLNNILKYARAQSADMSFTEPEIHPAQYYRRWRRL
jgi:signal transduction histidine kinase